MAELRGKAVNPKSDAILFYFDPLIVKQDRPGLVKPLREAVISICPGRPPDDLLVVAQRAVDRIVPF